MKYLKLYENFTELDPFGGENWDEEEYELKLGIVKFSMKNFDEYLVIYINDNNNEKYLAYLNLEYNEFDHNNKNILHNELIKPISDDIKNDIKNDKIHLKVFYKPIDSDEIDIRNYTYSELNHIIKRMDEVEFLSENVLTRRILEKI